MNGDQADRVGQDGGALPRVALPAGYNYVGVFLTFDCTLRCGYCLNRFGRLTRKGRTLNANEWAKGLSRLVTRPDLPVTLQGGEPTMHPDFHAIVSGIRPVLPVDLLTNLELDVGRFMNEIPPGRMKREAPYASIRVSYHPETMTVEPLAEKVLTLLSGGYSVGIWGVLHPGSAEAVLRAQAYCLERGIDFRTKEFLGMHEDTLHGHYAFPGACEGHFRKRVRCRTTELLIGPGGDVFRCHADLYEGREPVGHILDASFRIDDRFRSCDHFGHCNPCDVKTKTDRFQRDGHTSVTIESGE